MAWSDGVDRATGYIVTAADWNTKLGATGSLMYLKTQEMFFPATMFFDSSGPAYGVAYEKWCADTNDYAFIPFWVPEQFVSLTYAVVICQAIDTNASNSIIITSNYATAGQAFTTHSSTNTANYNTTATQIFEINVAGILGSLAADDSGYITIKNNEGDTGEFYVTGMKLGYLVGT
jgi:hypothetical protein